MAESFVQGTGVCGHCGGSIQTFDNPPTDDSILTCESCGKHIGTHKDVHDKIRQVTMDHAFAARDASIANFKKAIGRINRKIR